MATLPQSTLSILAPQSRRSLLDFAEDVYVPEGPRATAGVAVRYSIDWFPLQRAMLDAIGQPGAYVVIVGPPQRGKTLLQVITIAWQLYEMRRSVFYFNAAADTSLAFWDAKFLPTIRSSPTLRPYLPESRDEQGKSFLRRFTNGTRLRLAGSESPNQLAFHTAPVVIADDCQDMPPRLGERGHPIDLAMKRKGSFAPSQQTTLLCGTAGTAGDYHWQKLTASARYVPYVPCQGCGAYQWLDFDRMVCGDDPLNEGVYLSCASAGCDYRITDHDLPAMLSRVRWISCAGLDVSPATIGDDAVEYPASRVPTRAVGFWYNGLYWPQADWSDIAAEWRATRGNPDAEMSFRQNVQVVPQSPPKTEAITASRYDLMRDPAHKWGRVPMESECHNDGGILLAALDPGGGYVWWMLCAVRISDGRIWLIELGREGDRPDTLMEESDDEKQRIWAAGVEDAMSRLRDKFENGWAGPGGEVIRPTLVVCDRGFATTTVDRACGAYGWMSLSGSENRRSAAPVFPGWEKFHPVTRHYDCNTAQAKFEWRSRFEMPCGGPGGLTLPGDAPPKMAKLLEKHMSGEIWDEANGKWKRIGHNHYFDCGAMLVVAALACGVHWGAKPPPAVEVARAEPVRMRTPDGRPFLITDRE